jgi:hypothetical protein
MGFARTHQAQPFLEQWERTSRWYHRMAVLNLETPRACADELMDHVYACLQNCLMLRDWLLNSPGVERAAVRQLFGSTELKLCRDVANGTKHLQISKPSIDSQFMTVREYTPPSLDGSRGADYVLTLCADGRKLDLLWLCDECMRQVSEFMVGLAKGTKNTNA